MSEMLTRMLATRKLTIRKRKHISGEVQIMLPSGEPLIVSNFDPVDLSFLDSKTIARTNVRKLLERDKIEIIKS